MITASVVIYKNKLTDLEPLLCSLAASPVDELYIIDHSERKSSIDSDIDSFFERFNGPIQMKWHYLRHRNNGYGGGHNVAIRKAAEIGSHFHLVVNPDVWFSQETIPGLAGYMSCHESVGQIMPKVLFPNGSNQRVAKMLPTPFDILGRFLFPHFLIKRRNDRFELRSFNESTALNVPYLSGCFMFFRMSALMEVGLFDETLFMYSEDIDITRRMHALYETVFLPQYNIYHRFNRSSHRSLKLLWIHMINIIRYFNKWGWFNDPQREEFNKRLLMSL